MWALRRASAPLRSQRVRLGTLYAVAEKEMPNASVQNASGTYGTHQAISERRQQFKRFYHLSHFSSRLNVGRCSISSQAGVKDSGEDDDLEDGFSEPETTKSVESVKDVNAEDEDDEFISEPELSDIDDGASHKVFDVLDTEADPVEERKPSRRVASELFKYIMSTPGLNIHGALAKWVEEGNSLSRAEIYSAMLGLRKRKMYGRALQLSEWLEANQKLEFVERDYASRLDLIAKVRGLQKAENYIDLIPESCRGEAIYRTLLANCVVANNLKKAEEVFNKMKALEFPVTVFTYNQLLILYKRHDKRKIADTLLSMEKENVKPSALTYKTLIDAKGQANDMTGMEQIVETMKAEGIEPDVGTLAILAKHYTSSGFREKAEAVLKDMEGENLKDNRWVCRVLLPLYARLGEADEVKRIWKFCESKPQIEECLAAIVAWGKLNNIEEAEAVFERMLKSWKPSARQYSLMLKVYADHKMLTKGKDLVKRMSDNGCQIGPYTWDALVKLYVEAGEVEKADSVLQKAAQQNQMKPLYGSYMRIMEQYVQRGDVHNSEKMFYRMRQAGYVGRPRQLQSLIQAYINAKVPLYGIRERMKADNVYPTKALAGLLSQVDAFKKTALSDLLD